MKRALISVAILALAGCGSDSEDGINIELTDVQEKSGTNDVPWEAQAVEMGSRITGHLGAGNDTHDYYTVFVPSAGTLEIRLTGDQGTDFDLLLRNEDESPINQSADDFSDESISHVFSAAEEAIISVSSFAEAGNYTLSIYGEFSVPSATDGENGDSGRVFHAVVMNGAETAGCVEVPEEVANATPESPYTLGSCSSTGLNFAGNCTDGPSTNYYMSGYEAMCLR